MKEIILALCPLAKYVLEDKLPEELNKDERKILGDDLAELEYAISVVKGENGEIYVNVHGFHLHKTVVAVIDAMNSIGYEQDWEKPLTHYTIGNTRAQIKTVRFIKK